MYQVSRLFVIAAISLFAAFPLRAADVYVSNHLSLEAAVEAADPGDTVVDDVGVYEEVNLVLDKSLTIVGCGATTLVPADKTNPIITMAADNCTLTGMQFATDYSLSNSDPETVAVYANGVENLVVDSCYSWYVDKPIKVVNCQGSVIAGNSLYDCARGVDLIGGSDNTINANWVFPDSLSESRAIAVSDSVGAVLTNNSIRPYGWNPQMILVASNTVDTSVDISQNSVVMSGFESNDPVALELEVASGQTISLSGSFNRFYCDKAIAVTGEGSVVGVGTAFKNNWWGSNTAPDSDINVGARLQMVTTVNVPEIHNFASAIVTVSITTNSDNEDVSSLGSLPYLDNEVAFSADNFGGYAYPWGALDGGMCNMEYYPDAYIGDPGTRASFDGESQLVSLNVIEYIE